MSIFNQNQSESEVIMRLGYARVSTNDQSLDLQVDALKKAKCDEVFCEIASGAKTARPVLDNLLSRLRQGDVLVTWKLDRLGSNLKHIVTLTNELVERKIGLISLNDPIPVSGKNRKARSVRRHFGYRRGVKFYTWTSDQLSLYGGKAIVSAVRDVILRFALDRPMSLTRFSPMRPNCPLLSIQLIPQAIRKSCLPSSICSG